MHEQQPAQQLRFCRLIKIMAVDVEEPPHVVKMELKLVLLVSLALLANATDNHQVYIVYMGSEKYNNPTITKESHHRLLSSFLGSREAARRSILYSYKHGFSGFAARLTRSQAEAIEDLPGVIQVTRSRTHKLHTTRSWDFIGLQPNKLKNLSTRSQTVNGTIIGVIDSGVWPESRSFQDEGIGPAPSKWKGICQLGERFNLSNCNNKLIGARWFAKGVKPYLKTTEFLSPRDVLGHGTHTASTACGNFVENASYRGLAKGLARGGAPFAHLAVYKACWAIDEDAVCTDADILKAFDKAIFDGVDILSISLGLDVPVYDYADRRDSISIGSFHSVARGITVVASAGNDGPSAQTVVNVAPWIITVAASTIDRTFLAAISLGNNRTFWGQSIDTRKSHRGFVGLTYSEHVAIDTDDGSAKSCEAGTLNATLTAGKIVLCFKTYAQTDGSEMVSASQSVRKAGGVGVLLAQSRDDGLNSCGVIPCVKIDYETGTRILSYIRRAKSPVAKLSSASSVVGKLVSPRISSFSSRGPSSLFPQVLKPDVAAPGVDILAAYPPSGGDEYVVMSGTSMSCPHVAGIAALVKSVHPMWSPAAIRSAIVTTAFQMGTDGTTIRDGGSTNKAADPFDMGGGHVNPVKALDPGLIYDINIEDYIEFLCSMGFSSRSIANLSNGTTECKKGIGNNTKSLDLNLPSIVIPSLTHRVTVSRTVKNVGPTGSVYKVIVEAPYGVEVEVEPRVLRFNSSVQVVRFVVTFFTLQKLHGDYGFGSLTWSDGQHFVRIPLAVRVLDFGTSSLL